MNSEFEIVTKPIIDYLWESGFFTIPVPGHRMKEFALDMPAFKKFDIMAMKWDGGEVRVLAVECKRGNSGNALSQARSYQICVPEAYIGSDDQNVDLGFLKKYRIGYFHVGNEVRTLLEPGEPIIFSSNFYQARVIPRVKTILVFYDFLVKALGKQREEIKRTIDYSIQTETFWISDRPATEGVQWSVVYDDRSIRFGINIESKEAERKAFFNKTEEGLIQLIELTRNLPDSSTVAFYRRCAPGTKKMRGSESYSFSEFPNDKRASELTERDIKFIVEKARSDDMVTFAIWMEICKTNEIRALSRDDLLTRVSKCKTDYLDSYYDQLK